MNVRNQVEERINQAYKDMGDGNLEGLMTFFADDVVLLNPGQSPLVGIAALRAFWSKTLSLFVARVVPHVDEVDEFGDVVVLRGKGRGLDGFACERL